jgi:putative Holliday junction resolvase
MKVLALDYGLKRIGVSVGDTSLRIAFTRDYFSNNKDVLAKITEFVIKEQVAVVVFGKPLMLEGETSASLLLVEKFAKELEESMLKAKLKLQFVFVDERFSTNIAAQRLRAAACKKAKKREMIDSAAAQVILETYFSMNMESPKE